MGLRRLRGHSRDEGGNLAIMMALIAPAFVGAVGLSIETGYWYYLQDKAQAAADISAYAATVSLRNGDSDADAVAAGIAEAAQLGYSGPAATVTVNVPPTAGGFMAADAAEVIIEYEAPRYFSSILTGNTVIHSVRAVSLTEEAGTACVLALNSSASRALHLTGSSDLVLDGCEMMSNSLADDAFYLTGSAQLEADCVRASGGADVSGSGHMLTLDCGSPKPRQTQAADPYETVPEPVASDYSCEDIDDVVSGAETKKGKKATVSAPYTVNPGSDGVVRFCGGLSLQDTYTFEPGVYIVDGGTFSMNADADVIAEDVTFYLTGGAEISWNGSSKLSLKAPTSGTYSGIAIMGDRGDSSADHKINGNSSSELTGAIYTAASALEFLGSFSGENGCMQLIADTIKISGNVGFSQSCSPTGMAEAQLGGRVALVE